MKRATSSQPTIFAGCRPDMRIAQEEIFGPVLAVMRAKDFEDALRIANDIPLGLSSSIQTTQSQPRIRFHIWGAGRTIDGQSAERWSGIPASVRRDQGIELRSKRTGSGGNGILQRFENGLPKVLTCGLRRFVKATAWSR